MKRFFNTLVSTIVILLVMGAPTFTVKASSQLQNLAPNPAAEEFVRTEILASGDADLSKEFANENERVVSAEFIVGLWQNPDFQAISFFKLRHATILGDIKAEGISIPFNVELHDCTFTGGINLASADVKTFRIDDSTITGPVKLGRMVVKGDLALYNSTFEDGVTLFGADISNNLFARASKFLSTKPVPDSAFPFELWTTQVGQATEFTDAVFMGEVKADDAKFGVDSRFNNVVFDQPASFKNIQVGNIANFQGSHFKDWTDFDSSTFGLDARFPEASFDGKATFTNIRVANKVDFQKATFNDEVSFESSIMDRDAAFTGSTFNGNANFDYLAVARFLDLDQTTFNQKFSFIYTTVGWPYFEGATFNGTVDFEGMQASNDFDLTSATYSYLNEPFTVRLAKVNGSVLFKEFTAPAGLNLDHNQFGELQISTKENEKFAFVNLTSTKVANDLTMENVNTDVLSAEGFTVGDSTIFKNVNVAQSLNMSNASIGFFTMDQFSWPQTPDSFNLRGMTYTDIGLVNQELNDNTWSVLLRMVDQSAYSPQAYRTLAQFLTEKGHPDWAADVELSQKLRERDKILTPRSGPWFWSWFLYIFSGYGQRPDFAFIWSALVITIGAIIFRQEKDMVILDDSEAKPSYNPVLYSFALFLPYIDLDIASKWDPKPERKFAGIYKHVHRLMGWILMPIALLTFGGIIK
jgi:Pentapeptide repeats (9 copies)